MFRKVLSTEELSDREFEDLGKTSEHRLTGVQWPGISDFWSRLLLRLWFQGRAIDRSNLRQEYAFCIPRDQSAGVC